MVDVSQVRFDGRGLVPAIVQDEKTGKVLMVAWMNAESLERTMTTGLATFWSRSRQELWLKGATSGHYMHVREVRIDCDGDTLLVLVEPEGAACHTGAESCFFRTLEPRSAELIATGDATADYHVHTVFSDGAHTPEAMAEAALAAGLTTLGFADHSCVAFDDDYCMKPSAYGEYQKTIRALSSQYEGRLQVLCGIEQDYFSPWQGEGFDYVIGSVHYLRVPGKNAGTLVTEDNPEGEFLPLDISPEILQLGMDKYFGGDAYALAEAYYELVADVVRTTGCSIIGHFDLVKIFNGITEEGEPDKRFFDEHHPRYIAAWQKAADALLACGVPFEINVNGVARGRCAEPYPSRDIVRYLAERGARFVCSSDAHGTSFLKHHDERPELAFLGSLN